MPRVRRPLRTEMSNWEAIELYQRYKGGEKPASLRKSYNTSGEAVLRIVGAIEDEARRRGLAV